MPFPHPIKHVSGATLTPRLASMAEADAFPIPNGASEADVTAWLRYKAMSFASLVKALQANDPNGTYQTVADVVAGAKRDYQREKAYDEDLVEGEVIARTLTQDVTPFSDTPAGRRAALAFAWNTVFDVLGLGDPALEEIYYSAVESDDNAREVAKVADAYRTGNLK